MENAGRSVCGDIDSFFIESTTENADYFYELEAAEDTLLIKILTPHLVHRPGFADRYIRADWKAVYTVGLVQERKAIKFLLEEQGELSVWLALIRQGKIRSVLVERDIDIIRKVFPIVIDIYSLQMLTHIYQTKGLSYNHEIYPFTNRYSILYFLTTAVHELESGECLLEVCVAESISFRCLHMLVSDRYAYVEQMEEGIGLEYWMGDKNIIVDDVVEKDVMSFSQTYPGFGLKAYWDNGGRNIIIPLLAGEYHKGIELLAKSGCAAIAENMELDIFDRDPSLYKNVKEMVGLPLSIVRKIRSDHLSLSFQLLSKLAYIWEHKRQYLEVADHFTMAMLRFITENNVVHCEDPNYWFSTTLIQNRDMADYLTEKQILRIIKYLSSVDDTEYILFRDYLYCCIQLNDFPDGLTPKWLHEAHENAFIMFRERENVIESKRFHERVSSEEYRLLTTEQEDSILENEPFIVVAPESRSDLIAESKALHHCVRLYYEQVANGQTMILFLRRKTAETTPYVTIEVNSNHRIIQCKAFANSHAEKEAQLFVRKWAKEKGLKVVTADMSETESIGMC